MKVILENNTSILVIGGRDYLVDSALQSNIRSYLSVNVPGAFFTDQYKRHVWDGKKYYITPKMKFFTGMLPVLLGFIEDDYPDLPVEIQDERTGRVEFKKRIKTDVGDFSMDGEYEHQSYLVKVFNNYITFRDQKIYFPRGIVDAATNSGKTTVFAGIFNNIVGKPKMLILIHRKVIYKQLVEFMGSLYEDVGQVNDQYYEIRDITIAMAPSLANCVKESVVARNDVASFNVLAVDESHRASSKTYATIMKYSDAYCRVFMSGTALDAAEVITKLDIIKFSGQRLAKVTKVDMMKKGISTPVGVQLHLCNTMLYKPIFEYRGFIEECIHYSVERTAIIRKLIEASTGALIVAVDKILHGQFIYDQLKETPMSKSVEFTHGKDKKQSEKVQAFKNGEFDVLISTAVLSEGINLPLVQELIYAVGGRSKILIKQWMGRIERLSGGKSKATLHDFYDISKYVQKHSEARLKVYRDEELPVLSDFDLKDARKMKSIFIQ